jgi:photosystem II stability/assembly factor-like uncharacterized protein
MRFGVLRSFAIGLLCCVAVGGTAVAQQQDKPASSSLPDAWASEVPFRSIGPANMSGRIVDLAVNPQDRMQWWAATASGGLLRTDNNGATFTHQFDDEATVSIGAFDVSDSDPNILWIGTGEENPRNSSSWGDGVYKSTDGGETWKNMGLNKIFQTGAVVIHPTNPDVVFVGALGRLWGPSEDRGLYKTVDGGKTWKKVLYVDDRTGVIDLVASPADPNIMLAATYTRMRDGFDGNDPATKFGSGAGIWRSTDGGETWNRVNEGLPSVELGRIGLCFYAKDPNFVYAVVESKRIGQYPEDSPFLGIRGEDAETGAKMTDITAGGPAAEGGLQTGDIVMRVDDQMVLSYNQFLAEIRRHSAGEKVSLTIAREGEPETIEVELGARPEAEQSDSGDEAAESDEGEKDEPSQKESENAKLDALRRGSPFAQSLGGQNANMTDQQGDQGNEFGGVYRSSDAGVTWTRINSVNPRPMYYSKICVDPSDDNFIWVLGTSLYISKDGGETFTADGASSEVHTDHHAMWIDPSDGRHVILGCDGGIYVTHDRGKKWDHHNHVAIGQFYHVGIDTRRAYNVYGGLQDNGSWGGPSVVRNESGPVNTDWFRIGGGDGFICLVDPDDPDQLYYESQNGAMGRRNLRTGQGGSIRPRPPRGTEYRFNWKTPFILSPHNSEIHFSAGNYVFRSVKKGDAVQRISPEITRTDQGSGSAIGQSPLDENRLYVGTTDGMLWTTSDGGTTWNDLWKVTEEAAENESAAQGSPNRSRSGRSRGGRGTGQRNPAEEQPATEKADSATDKTDDPAAEEDSKEPADKPVQEESTAGDPKKDSDAATSDDPPAEAAKSDEPPAEAPPAQEPPAEEPAAEEPVAEEPPAEEPAAEEPAAEEPAAEEAQSEDAGSDDPKAEPAAAESPTDKAPQSIDQVADSAAAEADAPNQDLPPVDAKDPEPAKPADDPLSGSWAGKFGGDTLPPERSAFRLAFSLGEDGIYAGEYESSQAGGSLSGGKLDVKSGKLTIAGSTGGSTLVFDGTLRDGKISGTLDVNDGAFSVPFTATRTGDAVTLAAAESPAAAARDSGKPLSELLPKPLWVSSIEPSHFVAGRCYVTFDGHRNDVDGPFVLVTENGGRGWRRLDEKLPAGTGAARVIREDISNRDLLYLGTEFGLFVSIDRGTTWTRFKGNLPTVAVHEVAQHPTAGEIVIGTHGRSLWIADVTTLRQWKPATMEQSAVLFEPAEVVRWQSMPRSGDSGTRRFVGENPETDAVIYYSLGSDVREIELEIRDLGGRVLQRFDVPGSKGLHRVTWNLRRRGGSGRFASRVENGEYLVALVVGGETLTQTLSVVSDPEFATSGRAENERQLLDALYSVDEDDADMVGADSLRD